jgi:hypothetical protein
VNARCVHKHNLGFRTVYNTQNPIPGGTLKRRFSAGC